MEDFLKNAKVRATLLAVLCAGAAAGFRYLKMGDLEALMLAIAGGFVGKEYLLGSEHVPASPPKADLPRYQSHD